MAGVTPLLFGLGLVALGFAVISLILSVFGAALWSWLWTNLVVGVVLVAVAAASGFDSLRERMASGEGRRVGKYGTSAVLSTILGIAILGMLAWLSTRDELVRKFDWSEGQVHTLTQQSLDVLEGLDRDVRVTAFFREMDRPGARDLLDRYRYASDRFQVEYADPNTRPDLVQSLGVDTNDLARGLVHVEIGEESIDVTDLDESVLTNALVKLTRTGEKKVYFVVGHDERAIEGEEADEDGGFARAATALRNENYRTAKLLLATQGEVPEDADVVVVAGPERPFRDHEIAALERYLEGGGALFAMVDPLVEGDFPAALRDWGVELGDDVVIDPLAARLGSPMSPFGIDFDATHPVTQVLRADTPVFFHLARSAAPRSGGEGAGLQAIVRSSVDAWGERSIEEVEADGRLSRGEDDLTGPVPLLVAGAPFLASAAELPDDDEAGASTGDDARIVVAGDADFASNVSLDQGQNRDLFVNSVNWLLGDVEAITVRPNQSRASRLTRDQNELQRLVEAVNLSLILAPELIAVVGVFAWWSRRREGGSGR